ncbi:electron transfer flavoprotein [Pavlovales sp. CCMP2436]|nr:electron transfer flavoprotein [Pavlovales sp. CCMP2436]
MLALRAAHRAAHRASVRALSTLVLAEHGNGAINDATLSAITAASKLGGATHVLVVGKDTASAASAAAAVEGVSAVFTMVGEEKPVSEALTSAVLAAHKAGVYTHLVAPSTAVGKSVMPRVAALLDVCALSDVIAIDSDDTFQRPIYAGNAISTVKALDAIKVLTIRPTSFEKPGIAASPAPISSLDMPAADADAPSWFISEELSKSERPELASAGTVVSGGRGLKSADNFKLLDKLADRLGAAIGASRAAVDAGYCPNDMQVGQTGKVVAPDLYVAVGISGAIQHLSGMKDSKTIVAINTDPDAPIFQVADYGIVGDLFTVVPELDAKLEAARK